MTRGLTEIAPLGAWPWAAAEKPLRDCPAWGDLIVTLYLHTLQKPPLRHSGSAKAPLPLRR